MASHNMIDAIRALKALQETDRAITAFKVAVEQAIRNIEDVYSDEPVVLEALEDLRIELNKIDRG